MTSWNTVLAFLLNSGTIDVKVYVICQLLLIEVVGILLATNARDLVNWIGKHFVLPEGDLSYSN